MPHARRGYDVDGVKRHDLDPKPFQQLARVFWRNTAVDRKDDPTAEPILEELQEFKQTRLASLPLE